jgi:F0F1-type ATP synthase assembly protein I
MRTIFGHVLLFVPIAFLVMVVYVAPRATDARTVIQLAIPKTGKVLIWTLVIVVVMQLLTALFLP